jgi:hypothetical protein
MSDTLDGGLETDNVSGQVLSFARERRRLCLCCSETFDSAGAHNVISLLCKYKQPPGE